MVNVNLSVASDSLTELITQVEERGERIVIEQQGKVVAAIITYADLKRLEAIEAALLKNAELEEYEWLKSVIRNPAFELLNDLEEDIYTLDDGKPFHDSEWAKAVISNPISGFITDPEEDIYTINDGKPFHDQETSPKIAKAPD